MGANAQTTVPTFTAGSVLTAAQMNQSARTGVPVFANTTDRDAAFGGSGEKTLAEGQMCFLEDTNRTQYYDGAAWRTFGSVSQVVAETSFSAASSVTANSIYSSDFNFYQIVIQATSSNAGDLLFRNRVGGVSAATNYNYQELSVNSTTVSGARTASATSFIIGDVGTTPDSGIIVRLISPNLAKATMIFGESAYSSLAFTTPLARWRYGNHSTATAYDGFEFFPGAGTITGTYTVWGFAK